MALQKPNKKHTKLITIKMNGGGGAMLIYGGTQNKCSFDKTDFVWKQNKQIILCLYANIISYFYIIYLISIGKNIRLRVFM